MAEFPSREGEIIALALKLIQGLTENPDVFQSPVISPEELTATLGRFQDAEEEAAKEGESGPAAFGSPVCTLAGCHHYPDPRLLDRSRET